MDSGVSLLAAAGGGCSEKKLTKKRGGTSLLSSISILFSETRTSRPSNEAENDAQATAPLPRRMDAPRVGCSLATSDAALGLCPRFDGKADCNHEHAP
jgi:hypothetical protein